MKTDFEYQQMPFPVSISNLPLKVIEAKAIKGKEDTCRGWKLSELHLSALSV